MLIWIKDAPQVKDEKDVSQFVFNIQGQLDDEVMTTAWTTTTPTTTTTTAQPIPTKVELFICLFN